MGYFYGFYFVGGGLDSGFLPAAAVVCHQAMDSSGGDPGGDRKRTGDSEGFHPGIDRVGPRPDPGVRGGKPEDVT